MTLDDKVKKDDDTEVLVRRICPEFVFQGKKLWGVHLYMTTDKEREKYGQHCPTHYEIKQRYEKKQEGGL